MPLNKENKSTALAISVGTLVALGLGLVLSTVPVAGIVAGAWLFGKAALGAGMGWGITALSAVGGAVCGYGAGRVIKPLVIRFATGCGYVVGGAVKVGAVVVDGIARLFGRKQDTSAKTNDAAVQPAKPSMWQRLFKRVARADFTAAANRKARTNENKPSSAPSAKPAP